MNKKVVGLAICAVLLVLSFLAHAQQPKKIPRIGYLEQSTASGNVVLLEAFWQEMRKLGWIEGKNITIEYRFAEQKPERIHELAAELVRLKVDLIVVTGGGPALAAKKATTYHPYRGDESCGPRESKFGCQSGASGRQCHWVFEF